MLMTRNCFFGKKKEKKRKKSKEKKETKRKKERDVVCVFVCVDNQ